MSAKPRLEPADMAKIPFLAGLLPAEVEALCAAGEVQEHEVGGVIFRAGDPGRELHVLIDGEVAIELVVDGGSRLLTTLNPGTVFGEINYLLGSERTATARALRPTRILCFRRDALERLEGVGRQAATNMMETIARVLALRLANMDRELGEVCALVAKTYPEAAPALASLDHRRSRLKLEWTY